jgi:hypothetical protein
LARAPRLWALDLPCMASSAEPLRVGKPQSEVFSFVPLDIGIQEGIFKKHVVDNTPQGLS